MKHISDHKIRFFLSFFEREKGPIHPLLSTLDSPFNKYVYIYTYVYIYIYTCICICIHAHGGFLSPGGTPSCVWKGCSIMNYRFWGIPMAMEHQSIRGTWIGAASKVLVEAATLPAGMARGRKIRWDWELNWTFLWDWELGEARNPTIKTLHVRGIPKNAPNWKKTMGYPNTISIISKMVSTHHVGLSMGCSPQSSIFFDGFSRPMPNVVAIMRSTRAVVLLRVMT